MLSSPRPNRVGHGFAQLARHPAFQKAVLEQLMAATSGSRHQDAIKRIILITNSFIAYNCRLFVIKKIFANDCKFSDFLYFFCFLQDLFMPHVFLKTVHFTTMLSILHLVIFFLVMVGIHVLICPFVLSHHLRCPYKDQCRRGSTSATRPHNY